MSDISKGCLILAFLQKLLNSFLSDITLIISDDDKIFLILFFSKNLE